MRSFATEGEDAEMRFLRITGGKEHDRIMATDQTKGERANKRLSQIGTKQSRRKTLQEDRDID